MRRRTFGTIIWELRLAAGLSRKDLAKRMDVPLAFIVALERGVHHPSRPHLIEELARCLDVPADYLAYLAGLLPADIATATTDRDRILEAFAAMRDHLNA